MKKEIWDSVRNNCYIKIKCQQQQTLVNNLRPQPLIFAVGKILPLATAMGILGKLLWSPKV